jgi:hypothetical protein
VLPNGRKFQGRRDLPRRPAEEGIGPTGMANRYRSPDAVQPRRRSHDGEDRFHESSTPERRSGIQDRSQRNALGQAEAEASPDIHIVGFSALGLGLRPIMPLAFDVAAHLLVVVKAPSAIARRAVECNDGGEREPGGACGYEKNHGTRSTHQLRRREHRNVSDFALMLLCVHPPRSVIQGKKKPSLVESATALYSRGPAVSTIIET